MKCDRIVRLSTLGSVIFAAGHISWADIQYTFTTLDVSGSSFVQANGINDSGQIVGDVGFQGFLYQGGTVGIIDYPGSTNGTRVKGINSMGDIVGAYGPPATGIDGFLYSGGTFTSIPYEANGINDSGQIVGDFMGVSGFQGFLDVGGTFTTITVPRADATFAESINDNGQITGYYYIGAQPNGFVDTNGVLTPIDVLGADGTVALGINTKGEIAG